MMRAEFWARWLGIKLNEDKREIARLTTRHLGFMIDLKLKAAEITAKHQGKDSHLLRQVPLGCSEKGSYPD